MKHLIIARYREDAGWLKDINFPIYLYDKSYKAHVCNDNTNIIQQTLPNIGREAHTYNQYILDNYYCLPDICIFSQCSPFEHVENFIDIINKDTIEEMWQENLKCYPDSESSHDGFLGLGKSSKINLQANHGEENFWWLKFKVKNVYSSLLANNLPQKYTTSHGAIMVVKKENILSNPIKVYERMMTLHENTNFPAFDWSNETAVALEHLWTIIFKKEIGILSENKEIEKWII